MRRVSWSVQPLTLLFSFLFGTLTCVLPARAAQLTVSWDPPTSGVPSGFDVERAAGTTGAFAQIAGTAANVLSYVDTGLTGGGYYCYRALAYNAAGTSAYSNTACGTAPTDTQPPTVSLTAPANGATVSGSAVTVSASASDNGGVAGVQFQLDGTNLGSEDTTSPYSITWNTTTTANGAHSLTALARDAAGNTATSTAVSVTVSNTVPPPPPTSGLVAAYGFNEGSGSTVSDASGNGNNGAIAGAAWVTSGKAGAALSFNGTNSWVTINDFSLLHLTTGMTLEAWIYPTALGAQHRTVILKEATITDASFNLYATEDVPNPITYVNTNGYQSAQGPVLPPLNAWTHLASTYDGSTLKIYLNGIQVGSTAVTGSMITGSGPLRIGGNSLWGEYFQGQIDEVRIYNRALSTSELQTDMNTPVGTIPPPTTYALTVTKTGTGSGTVSSSPAGISCGATCTASYNSGTVVTLTATPAAGSTFAGWSGACNGAGSCTVTMSANATVTAIFTTLLNVKIGVFRPSTGQWFLDVNGNGLLDDCQNGGCLTFGQSGDKPVVGDWNGTGTVKLGVYTPSINQWSLDRNGNDQWEGCTVDQCVNIAWASTDLPVVGRWTTASLTDRVGIYRPSRGYWRLDLNGDGVWDHCTTDGCWSFGYLSGLPVVGDWSGSGVTQLGIFDSATGLWKLDLNGNGALDACTIDGCVGPFGVFGDQPVAGDWNGTGRAKIGVFDSITGLWKLDRNGNGTFDGCSVDTCLGPFGQLGDVPVVGKW